MLKTNDFYFIGAVIENFVVNSTSQDYLREVVENRFDFVVSFDANDDNAGLSGMEVAIFKVFSSLCKYNYLFLRDHSTHVMSS